MWLNIRLSWKITKIRTIGFKSKTGVELPETGVLFLMSIFRLVAIARKITSFKKPKVAF